MIDQAAFPDRIKRLGIGKQQIKRVTTSGSKDVMECSIIFCCVIVTDSFYLSGNQLFR